MIARGRLPKVKHLPIHALIHAIVASSGFLMGDPQLGRIAALLVGPVVFLDLKVYFRTPDKETIIEDVFVVNTRHLLAALLYALCVLALSPYIDRLTPGS